MFKLPKLWLEELHHLFTAYVPNFEVWAYGSRVTGNCHEASDLDLVLIHPETPESSYCENLIELKEALQESNLPISVDVMDWARIPAEFHAQINRNKRQIFPIMDTSIDESLNK
jgi:predicted nucleotidyltransferase